MPSLQRTAIDIGESYTNHGLSLAALKQLNQAADKAVTPERVDLEQ
jgi:hypothetical protein